MTHNPPTNQQLTTAIYDSLAAFAGVACWNVLQYAQNRQYLAEHLTEALAPLLSTEAHTYEQRLREQHDLDVAEVRRLRAAQPVALPARWECANGPANDEPYCAEAEDDTHVCPTIRVHPDDAEIFAALVTAATAPSTGPAAPQTLCRTCATPIGYIDAPTGGWWAHETHPADEHDAVPGAWTDGDELMETIAATVWQFCGTEGSSLIVDDPRNIAGAAAAVARRAIAIETDRIRRDRDLAIAHDRQPYPTAWAYEQACKALEAHRGRADAAEAKLGGMRADVLREVVDICDEAASVHAEQGADDPDSGANAAAGALFALMERFQRKADEAEYVATPCDPMVPCEDGGEPCHVHERLMAHAEGDHELCEPDCGVRPALEAPRPGGADTLPAWLAKRFDPRGADWDGMSDDDRAYWAHQAAAVRRAVARGGFKATTPA